MLNRIPARARRARSADIEGAHRVGHGAVFHDVSRNGIAVYHHLASRIDVVVSAEDDVDAEPAEFIRHFSSEG